VILKFNGLYFFLYCIRSFTPPRDNRSDRNTKKRKPNIILKNLSAGSADQPEFIRFLTLLQDWVMRKLSLIFSIMRMNLFIGAAKVSVLPGTNGLAETSNIPKTPLGRPASFSR
jgi:hypothetical protein